MEFRRKIVVITGGACKLGSALASKLIQEGARVVIADKDEISLQRIASMTGAIPIVTNCLEKDELKLLVNRVICRFGKIDLFIWHTEMYERQRFLISEGERSMRWHRNVMSQMYAAKYALPYMINRGMGYFVNTIPAKDLMNEFHFSFYNTIKHPALSFAERLKSNYRNAGIKVSVLCIVGIRRFTVTSLGLASMVIQAIHKERFMIMPCEKACKRLQKNRIAATIIRNRKIKTAA